jgi:glycosyltransferase involved in cell wall biosynthesis
MNEQEHQNPLISVIMPVYNGEKFIRAAIDSVIGQTYKNWELVIFDDASEDSTRSIINEVAAKDARIRLIEGKERGGQSKARNAAIAASHGVYIALLDADDIALPSRLEIQHTYLESHPDIAVAGSWTRIEEANGSSYIYRSETDPDKVAAGLLFNTMLINSSVMMRASFLRENALSYDISSSFLAEDYALWARCAEVGKLANVPKVLVIYKKHPGAISAERREELAFRASRVRERVLGRIGLRPTPEESEAHNDLRSPLSLQYAWFKRIQEANVSARTFNQHALKATLENRFHDATFVNLSLKNSLFFFCRPFTATLHHYYLSLKLVAKSLVK